MMGRVTTIPIPYGSTAITVFRALPNGDAETYNTIEFKRGNQDLRRWVADHESAGHLAAPGQGGIAILDFLDADDDILGDCVITTDAALSAIVAQTGMVMEFMS